MLDTYDESKCGKLFARFSHNETWQVPTFVVFNQSGSSSDPRVKYLPASMRPAWLQQLATYNNRSPEQQATRKKMWEKRLSITAGMAKAGVPLLAGTDVAAVRLFSGFSLHDELAFFVQAGLSPGEALRTATYNPAKFLGQLERFGTIEKGKVADLVLLDANPLEDIHNTQKIQAVVLNGRYLDRHALDKLLADAAATASVH